MSKYRIKYYLHPVKSSSEILFVHDVETVYTAMGNNSTNINHRNNYILP